MRKSFALALLVLGCGGGTTPAPAPRPEPRREGPPATRLSAVIDTVHGTAVDDPYRWLEDGESAEVQAWADAQNAYARRLLDATSARAALRARLEQLVSIGSVHSPRVFGRRVFSMRRSGTENQPSLYVRDGFEGDARKLLDPNALSADATVAVDWWHPSRDGSLVAYGTSEGGSEISTLRVRNVADGTDLPDAIPFARAASVEWTRDGRGFFYTRYPEPGSVAKGDEKYFRRVYYHRLGSDPSKDPMLFGRGRDKTDWPGLALSTDDRYLVANVYQGWSKSEVYLCDRFGDARWTPLVEKVEASFTAWVEGGRLYVHTNDGAPRYRLMTADLASPTRESWKELIPQGEGTMDDVVVMRDRIVVHEGVHAHSRLRVFGLDGAAMGEIALPALGSVSGLHASPGGDDLVFQFASFFVPPALYRYEAATGALTVFERLEANVDLTAYVSKQVFYPSKDGTKIPMFLVHRKELVLDGSNPTMLNGYGGFAISMTPFYSGALVAWLEKGGVFAMPCLRGGGEYGEEWHQAGMRGKKQNVFDDFIAAAEWLIAEKITSPAKLAVSGGSNGGLLVGAFLTQRPDLCRAVVCAVPLLDMVRYPKFLIAKLWVPEYGDPEKAEEFAWLYAYSPYHRVRHGEAYPAVLLMTADTDTRVDPLHARKMCARLQAATSSGRPVLLRVEKKAGHGAGKPLSKRLDEMADEYGFVMWQLGVSQ